MQSLNDESWISWTHHQKSQQIVREIKEEIDKLASRLVNGDLINYADNDLLAREYCIIQGQIMGLLFLEKKITDIRESKDDDI